MNFTKEYIKECDCKEIQGLRKYIEHGSWLFEEDKKVHLQFTHYTFPIEETRNKYIWLPTGDQLDDEIVKYIEDEDGYYKFYYDRGAGYITEIVCSWDSEKDITAQSINPLIAKIKLLKSLLKEQ